MDADSSAKLRTYVSAWQAAACIHRSASFAWVLRKDACFCSANLLLAIAMNAAGWPAAYCYSRLLGVLAFFLVSVQHSRLHI